MDSNSKLDLLISTFCCFFLVYFFFAHYFACVPLHAMACDSLHSWIAPYRCENSPPIPIIFSSNFKAITISLEVRENVNTVHLFEERGELINQRHQPVKVINILPWG